MVDCGQHQKQRAYGLVSKPPTPEAAQWQEDEWVQAPLEAIVSWTWVKNGQAIGMDPQNSWSAGHC